MNVLFASVRTGKHCLTHYRGRSTIRRVTAVMPDGSVHGESRSILPSRGVTWNADVQEMLSLASRIAREVPCDWTPEKEG